MTDKEWLIERLKKVLEEENPKLADSEVVPGYDTDGNPRHEEWRVYVDEGLTFEENQSILERYFPELKWRHGFGPPRLGEKVISPCAGPGMDAYFCYVDLIIKPHKVTAKGKQYGAGRIQMTVPEELIGHRARVTVLVPGAYDRDGRLIRLNWSPLRKNIPKRKSKEIEPRQFFEF
jgi:hypothetical protein